MEKVLIIAAHPDDEVLGCGGSVLLHSAAGDDVYCLVLGDGETARMHGSASKVEERVAKRKEALNEVCKMLGVSKHWLLSFPDNRFDSVPLLEIVQSIEKIISEVQPSFIYTHFGGDLNIDHRLTFQAVLTACRPLVGSSVRKVYSFEVPSSTEWSTTVGDLSSHFIPNIYVDVSKTIEKKIAAFLRYESEVRPYPHPRSPEALKTLAQYRGIASGLGYAEAFCLIRDIK